MPDIKDCQDVNPAVPPGCHADVGTTGRFQISTTSPFSPKEMRLEKYHATSYYYERLEVHFCPRLSMMCRSYGM
jgi:hypothetical protein